MLRPHAAHKGSFFMPSFRAPTAKRAMNHSEAIPQNDCDFITNVGVYRGYNDTKNMNNEDIGTIVVSLPWDSNSRQQIVFVAGGKHIFHRAKTPVSWGEYTEIAQCVAPEVHDLPLYNGYTNLGCKYFRTQENVVSFAGEIERMSGFHQDEAFAVLPEGFRPDHAIVVPALLYPSFTPASIIIKSNGEICETITSSDKSLYMQATFVAG